jgi:hypothetical protein
MTLKSRVVLAGGIGGALVGALAAYLYLKSIPEEGGEGGGLERLPPVQPGKAISVTLGVLTVIKQITGLGQRT